MLVGGGGHRVSDNHVQKGCLPHQTCFAFLVLVFALLGVQYGSFETLWFHNSRLQTQNHLKTRLPDLSQMLSSFKIGPKFSETHIFEKTFYTPCSEDLEKNNASSAGYIIMKIHPITSEN